MGTNEATSHVKNVTNKKYLNCFPDGQGFYWAPSNYTVSLNYQN